MKLNEMDIDLRRAERAAATGDPEAQQKYIRALVRTDQIKDADEIVQELSNKYKTEFYDWGAWNRTRIGILRVADNNYCRLVIYDESGRGGIYYVASLFESPAGGFWWYIVYIGPNITGDDEEFVINFGPMDEEEVNGLIEDELMGEHNLVDYLTDYL